MTNRNALLSAACLVPFIAVPALAQNAGVTAAVNQSAQGALPGGQMRTITLGDNIIQNERIDTDDVGLVQILLADGTAFTVGPNSSITIDRFVYDPGAGTAQLAASLARGTFRFIGGRASKTEGGVVLNTPVGTAGIRGGLVNIRLALKNSGIIAHFDLVFGNEVTLKRGGKTERVYQQGYSIVIGAKGEMKVIKTPPGFASQIQLALSGKPGKTGGSPNSPTNQTVASSGVPASNSKQPKSSITPPGPPPFGPDDSFIADAMLDIIRFEQGEAMEESGGSS